MYTDDEKRVGLPLKTFILSLIMIIIFILLLMWLLPMPKNSNNNNNSSNENCSNSGNCPEFPNISGLTNRIFIENIKDMKDAAISYFTTDKLPGKEGESVTLTLQEMLDKHLLLPLTDKNGNTCDTKGSYVTLTKLKDSYELKVNLKCGDEEAYILVPLGCYSYCTSAVCENKDKKTPIVPVPVKPTPKPTPTPTPTPTGSSPSCELYVAEGISGNNGWYLSDANVMFKSKTTTNGATITEFGLGLDANKNFNGASNYVVNTDGTTTVYGHVKDSNGYTYTCSINVKRDTVKPNCEVSVISGTKKESGSYVGNVVIGLTSKTDIVSGLANYGMSNNSVAIYNMLSSYIVSTDGTHTIYGFVKDIAGNSNVCSIKIKRESDPVPSKPSCELQILNGAKGENGWYVGDVSIGFKSKTTTNGARITAFGIGTKETYAGNTTYLVQTDGTITVVGYVKDSNGNTASCNINVKRDATAPSCELRITKGTYKKIDDNTGYYISDVEVGFASVVDSTSKINAYGMGESKTASFNSKKLYTVSGKGTHNVYGYVKDRAGNVGLCSKTVVIKDNLLYQYKKDIATQYSEWSGWTTLTYSPSNPPKFGKYNLIEMVDLGKTTVIDYYKQTTGEAFYKYKTVKVGTATQTYCTDYDYYREKTTNKTYAIKKGTEWKSAGMVTTTGWPTDSLSVKYEFVGFDWKCTGCERTPKKIWNKYTRTTYTATSLDSVTSSSKVTVKCAATETKTIEIFDTVKIFVDYEIIKTPVYKDVYNYKKRTRSVVQEAYTDYKWSYYEDMNLLNNGYTYTGNTKAA